MVAIRIFVVCTLIPTILSQCTVEKAEPLFRRSVYEFSVDLLSRIALEKDNHFVTSTFSIWVLLSCASLGASGGTLNELKQVLQLNENKCFNNKYMKLASTVTTNNDTGVILERSALIFVDKTISLSDFYKARLGMTSIADVETASFDNPDVVAYVINEYVRRATHDTIEDIITPADLENSLIVMLDAIFFKGIWKKQFSVEDTEVSAFYNDLGDSIGDVNLMFISSQFKVGIIKQIDAQILELPYGNSDRYSMILFLPLDGVPLYNVISNLKSINLASIKNFLKNDPITVQVQIPRFEISSDLNNLKELMIDMGLKAMFEDRADFSFMSDFPLHISNFIQKAHIEVTEEGTVSSASTLDDFSFRSMPYQFIANKPFLYMIVDKQVEVPLFMGAYSKPSLY
ncbi:serine protease inhibitor 77Ba-like [Danaus plexippus]|uniref:serine protease inhibitor 77Ba-like n=1 Tax=Danaus plexippus TaxID=13037 RepID=UPI002AB032C0|nr:serine protease inhibitor 77Ba-like [Danaus plexippus]